MSQRADPIHDVVCFHKQVWKGKRRGKAQTKNNIRPGAASLFPGLEKQGGCI